MRLKVKMASELINKQYNYCTKLDYPEVTAYADLSKIQEKFFIHDCVLIRGLLKTEKLEFFRKSCQEIYADDDLLFQSTSNHDEKWFREYENGWIWEERLRHKTKGVFGYEDIMGSKAMYDILSALLGNGWYVGAGSQIRRMAPPHHQNRWGSQTNFHLDAQWGIDHRYIINVWAPFTPCGQSAPGLEFLLIPANTIREHSCYNPDIPYEPRGPGGISPRIDYKVFEPAILETTFSSDRFWAPVFEPGDVMLFSNWCTHRTHILPSMTETRISIEWRISTRAFDTAMRIHPITSL